MTIKNRSLYSRIALLLAAGALWSCSDDTTTRPKDPYSVIEAFIGNGQLGIAKDGVSPLDTPLYWPQDITIGPDGRAYVIDWNNYRVRVVENGIIRTIIGSGNPVPADGEDPVPTGPAQEVDLNHMTHVTFDPDGNITLSGFHSSAVFKYDFATDLVTALCGNGARSFGGDGGLATAALVNLPVCTGYNSEGELFIMDQANQRIRRVTNGIIDTFVGDGTPGFGGDEGPPEEAFINLPVGQAAQPAGKFIISPDDVFYIADTGNNRVRIVAPDDPVPGGPGVQHEDYTIDTFAGNGIPGFSGDGGPATDASLKLPNSVAIDSQGNVYISDTYNHVIRKVDTNGIITTFAGHPERRNPPPPATSNGNGGHPLDAYLDRPAGIFIDSADNLYIADLGHSQIRVIRKNPQ